MTARDNVTRHRSPDDRAGVIPVIDIGPFLRGEAAADEVVAAVERAARAIGFFLVTGHGVPEDVALRLHESARAFFDLPEDAKRRTERAGDVFGGVAFAPLATEALAATRGRRTPGDYKESLNFGPRLPGGPWPERPVGLDAAFAAYFREMDVLAAALRRIFCRAIGLAPEYFEQDFDGHLSALRVIHYPPQSAEPLPGQLRAGEHTDYGFLTILRAEASEGGLQVQRRDGAWIDVPVIEGAFVVNIGDAFMRWTNDAWVSTPHRVANVPRGAGGGTRRQSIAFFLNPRRDTVIACLPPFQAGGTPAKYPPITYGEYIELKTRQAFGG